MNHPDTNEILHYGCAGRCFYDDVEQTKDQDIISLLRSENAYLRGKIEVYEKLLRDKGFTKEEENEKVSD